MSLDGGLGAVQEVSGPTSLVPLLQSGAPLDSTGDTRRGMRHYQLKFPKV